MSCVTGLLNIRQVKAGVRLLNMLLSTRLDTFLNTFKIQKENCLKSTLFNNLFVAAI